jgi:hypothetical protein
MSRFSVSTDDTPPPPPVTIPVTIPPLTVTGMREMGQARLEKLHKPRLIEGITACMALIDLLESGSKVSKVTEVSKIRSELKELKLAVFTNASTSTTVCAVTQYTQDVLDRPNIGWDAIHKMAKEQNPAPDTTEALNAVVDTPLPPPVTAKDGKDAPPAGENSTGELAKRVKLVRSTDLWCLLPFVPVTQEARDKPRKVCLLNLRGEVCTAANCGSKHPKVCLVADPSKGNIPKVTCLLWHMRIPFAGNAGNATGRRNGSNHPSGSKGSKAKVAIWRVKPDTKLVKLTGHGHGRRAEGEDQDGKVDVTRCLRQPDGAGPGPGPRPCPPRPRP